MSLEPAVIVFARYPQEGKVKTRLAASIGHPYATKFYKACAELVIASCASVPNTRCYIFYSSSEDRQAVATWLSSSHPNLCYAAQTQDNDLGSRLHHALRYVADLGHTKALVVGTDVPSLRPSHIQTAVTLLDSHQAVLGPAKDGGYYLIGIQSIKLNPGIFENIEWSTETVLRQQIDALQKYQVTVAPVDALPVLADIDTLEDLKAWESTLVVGVEDVSTSLAANLLGIVRQILQST